MPAQDRQQIRLWIDELLHREGPGDVEMGETGQKSAVDMATYYYRLTKERRKNLGDDLLSKLIDRGSNATTARWCHWTTSKSRNSQHYWVELAQRPSPS